MFIKEGCVSIQINVRKDSPYSIKKLLTMQPRGCLLYTSLLAGMKNVAFLRTNIEIIERFFAAGEVSEIWLTLSLIHI